MESVNFLANIGNSDLGINGKPYFGNKSSFDSIDIYKESKRLYESDNYNNLELLLLDSVVKKAQSFDLKNIYLFCTHQQSENEEYHHQDTLYIGYIIKNILINKYGLDSEKIHINVIPDNPSDYDLMLDFFSQKVYEIDDADKIWVSITGGAPAQYFSAMLESIGRFGDKVTTLYKSRTLNDIVENDIGQDLYKKFMTERVKILKNYYFYGLAAELAEEYGTHNEDEIKLLKAKNYRSMFDFKSALDEIKDLEDKESEFKDEINKQISELEQLLNKDSLSIIQINELYENLCMKWEQGAYVDFLGRLFRFKEAVLRYIIENEFNIRTDKDNKRFENYKNDISSNIGLKNYLDKKYRKENLDYNEPRVPVLKAIFSYFSKYSKEKESYKELENIRLKLADMENLSTLRNRSIMAHGFEGVSKENIDEYYKSNSKGLLDDIEYIMNILNSYYGN